MSTCARCGHELGGGPLLHQLRAPDRPARPRVRGAPRPHDASYDVASADPARPGRPSWLFAARCDPGMVLAVALRRRPASLASDDRRARRSLVRGPHRAPVVRARLHLVRPRDRPTSPPRPASRRPTPAPATTDLDGSLVGYAAEQMVDGVPQTAWRTGGDASASTILFTLRRPTTLTRVRTGQRLHQAGPQRVRRRRLVSPQPTDHRRRVGLRRRHHGGPGPARGAAHAGVRIDPVTTRTVQRGSSVSPTPGRARWAATTPRSARSCSPAPRRRDDPCPAPSSRRSPTRPNARPRPRSGRPRDTPAAAPRRRVGASGSRSSCVSSDVALLATYGARPAGMIVAEPYLEDGAVDPACGHISMVFVDPGYWGSGDRRRARPRAPGAARGPGLDAAERVDPQRQPPRPAALRLLRLRRHR